MAFEDFDVEIQDIKDSSPECTVDSIDTTETDTISHSSGRNIMFFFLEVPGRRDPDLSNGINDAIKYSIDGGTNYFNLMSGESVFLPANCTNIKLQTNSNGTNYRIIIWG